jgi:2-polyprenyl-6-methoxyphenol hydroxylase-like FAD-dependent oxidoreductase
MQEILLERAVQSGAEAWRSAVVVALRPGELPEADIVADGFVRTVKARLVVGADGRESQIATLLEFERVKDAPELFPVVCNWPGICRLNMPSIFPPCNLRTGEHSSSKQAR